MPKNVGGRLGTLILREVMAGGNEAVVTGSNWCSNKNISVRMRFASEKKIQSWSFCRSSQKCSWDELAEVIDSKSFSFSPS